MPELLALTDVSKTFGAVVAVDRVSLEIPTGDFLAIFGRSGSGKTTLLNLIAGLDTPSDGCVAYRGQDLGGLGEDGLADWRRRHVGLVFQAFHVIPTLSALENVALPLFPERLPAEERRVRARRQLEQVGLAHRASHRPGELSAGEQQRVAIARALVNEPELVLADEPTGNLDSRTGAEVMDLFRRLWEARNVTFVVVTHDEQVASSADRGVYMSDGRMHDHA